MFCTGWNTAGHLLLMGHGNSYLVALTEPWYFHLISAAHKKNLTSFPVRLHGSVFLVLGTAEMTVTGMLQGHRVEQGREIGYFFTKNKD